MEHRTDFRNASTNVLQWHKCFSDPASEMGRERSHGLARIDRNRARSSLTDGLAGYSSADSGIFGFPSVRRFVAVVFRHGALLSKERPAVDAWNSSIYGRPAFSVQKR
jgi:hypothetical protein